MRLKKYNIGGAFTGVTGPNVLPEAEVRPSNQATYQDSAAAYEATQRMLDQMRREGFTDEYRGRRSPAAMDEVLVHQADNYSGRDFSMNDHLRHMRGEFTPEERALFEKNKDEFRADPFNANLKGDIYDYFGARDRVDRGDMVYASVLTGHLGPEGDIKIPHDPRIMPEEQVTLLNPETGAIINVPLNPKPSPPPPNVVNTARVVPHSLPPYGTMTGPPSPPESLPMRGAMQIPTEERDMNLRPMRVIKSTTGRQPELIYKSSNRTRTEQEPNYYRVWDDKRKQWTTRPVEPEELERYLKENKRL